LKRQGELFWIQKKSKKENKKEDFSYFNLKKFKKKEAWFLQASFF